MSLNSAHQNDSNEAPSPWVCRFSPLIRSGGDVLDLACGSGRHARWLAGRGWQVEAVDRDEAALAGLRDVPGISTHVADLEQGLWPYAKRRFDGIVISRYLHRPLLPLLAVSLNEGGVLIYETFMQGHERYGRPQNPDFLLRPDELLQAFSPSLTVIAFEQGEEQSPRPAVMQRICAVYAPSN
jgi:SAM-dependent methyltransferase